MSSNVEDQIKAIKTRAHNLEAIASMLSKDPDLAKELAGLVGMMTSKAIATHKGSVADNILDALQKNGNKPLTIAELVEKTGREKSAIRQVLYRVQKARFRQHKKHQGRETGFSLKAMPRKSG